MNVIQNDFDGESSKFLEWDLIRGEAHLEEYVQQLRLSRDIELQLVKVRHDVLQGLLIQIADVVGLVVVVRNQGIEVPQFNIHLTRIQEILVLPYHLKVLYEHQVDINLANDVVVAVVGFLENGTPV